MSTLESSREPQPITALSGVKPAPPKKPARRRKDDDLAEQDQLTDEEMSAPGRKWYFVHTYSGHENKVRHAIKATVEQMDAKDKVFHVVVPTEDKIEIRDGQRRTVKRKLYPGYVLVQTIELKEGDPDSDEAWHMIRNTTGVTGFVSSGTRPVPLSDAEVGTSSAPCAWNSRASASSSKSASPSASSMVRSKTSSDLSTRSIRRRARSKSSSTCLAAKPR